MFLLIFLVTGTAELDRIHHIRQLLDERNYQQCSDICAQQIESSGILNSDPELFLLSGQCSFHLNNFRESNRQLSRFITSRTISPEDRILACGFRARSRLKLGLFEDAIKDATQSGLTSLPGIAAVARDDLNQATSLHANGDCNEALKLYKKVMLVATEAAPIHVQAAKCAAELGDRSEFVRLAERATELSPGDDDLLEMRSRFIMCEGAIDKAISICQTRGAKCERFLSKLKEFQWNYANGRLEKCQRIVSGICPETCGLSQIVTLAMVSAMVSEGRSESAIQILNRCIELNQSSIDFLLQRADLHLKLQQADEALADYRTVCRLDSDNRRAIDGIQQILAAGDDSDLYWVLGISKGYTLAELKAAYRREARHWHPDRFTDPARKKEAEHRMKLINRALEIFSDPTKKMMYDQGRDPDTGQYNGSNDDEKFVTRFNPFEQLLQSVKYQYGTPFE
jgi:tetratricopeptide (TPR) repeat protein